MSQPFPKHPHETSNYNLRSEQPLFSVSTKDPDKGIYSSTVEWKHNSHDHMVNQNNKNHLHQVQQTNNRSILSQNQNHLAPPILPPVQTNANPTSSSHYSYRVFYKTKEGNLENHKQLPSSLVGNNTNQAVAGTFYPTPQTHRIPHYNYKLSTPGSRNPFYPVPSNNIQNFQNSESNRLNCNSSISQLNQNKPFHFQKPSPMSASTSKVSKPGPKLIWLLFMHRHGDRAPLNMAPRDKYNNITYWPEGFGNLNNAGRLRMFKLGKFIRKRYENFLTDNIREVYSRSSDVDRCIESSHAVLAGLYPPSSQFEWNKDLLWTPAPVHTVPAPEDYLLNEAGRKFLIECVQEIHKVQASDAVKKLYEESVNERALLEKEIGYDYDMFYKFKCTYSTLDIEERSGLEMPDWYTPELKQKLYRFAGIAFGLAGGGTEKLKKIRCGHLLDDIIARMTLTSTDEPVPVTQSDFQQPTNAPSEDSRRVVHYSTHDSIMAAFLESLNVNTPMPVPPGFGATFFIELYIDLDENGHPIGEKYVKLFYLDDTYSEKPIEKKLPGCILNDKGQLTLECFKSYVAHLLPGQALDIQP